MFIEEKYNAHRQSVQCDIFATLVSPWNVSIHANGFPLHDAWRYGVAIAVSAATVGANVGRPVERHANTREPVALSQPPSKHDAVVVDATVQPLVKTVVMPCPI